MRLLSLVIFALMLVGCGRPAGNSLIWPVHVRSVEGFSPESESRLRAYIKDLNEILGGDLFTEDESVVGSPISIRMVNQFAGASSDSSNGLRVAGRATVSGDDCAVEIADFVVNDSNRELFKPVTLHELGHCAGLRHTSSGLMAPTTLPWPSYTIDELTTFRDDFLRSIGLAE